MEAIQAAMREASAAPSRSGTRHAEEVAPLALIVDDREAESARPAALRLGERWLKEATMRLKSFLRADVEVRVAGAEIMSGEVLRDGLAGNWLLALAVEGRPLPALMAAGGPLLGAAAGAMCGANLKDKDKEASPPADEEPAERIPSAATLKIFQPVGEALAAALADAWREEQTTTVTRDARPDKIEAARRALLEADVVVALTMQVSGASGGRLRLLARPATLVRPPPPIEAVAVAPGALETALGRVPVDLKVELGRMRLTMREFENLKVGTILTLPQFVDDPLPIFCGGVVKACGRPVVSRGVIAVQIDRVFRARGKRTA